MRSSAMGQARLPPGSTTRQALRRSHVRFCLCARGAAALETSALEGSRNERDTCRGDRPALQQPKEGRCPHQQGSMPSGSAARPPRCRVTTPAVRPGTRASLPGPPCRAWRRSSPSCARAVSRRPMGIRPEPTWRPGAAQGTCSGRTGGSRGRDHGARRLRRLHRSVRRSWGTRPAANAGGQRAN